MSGGRLTQAAIDFAPVADPNHQHQQPVVVKLIDDTVVAVPQAISVR